MQALNSGMTRRHYPALTSWRTHYHLFAVLLLQSVLTGLRGHNFRVVRDNSPTRSLPHKSLWHNLHTSVWLRRSGHYKRVDQPGVWCSLQASGQVTDPVGPCSEEKTDTSLLTLLGQVAGPGGAEASLAHAEMVPVGMGGFAVPSL